MTFAKLRVWLDDHPGTLGTLASLIGGHDGDVVGIDVLERGAGRVIDELVVQIPHPDVIDEIAATLAATRGIDVESAVTLPGPLPDPRVDALELASQLLAQLDVDPLLRTLSEATRLQFRAQWSIVMDPVAPSPLAFSGKPPPVRWLASFVAGARLATSADGPRDVAWAPLDLSELVLLLGRNGEPFRDRERRQLTALGRIADHRWTELTRSSHPSNRLNPIRARVLSEV
jgi:hypothetical protein